MLMEIPKDEQKCRNCVFGCPISKGVPGGWDTVAVDCEVKKRKFDPDTKACSMYAQQL